MRRDIDEHPDIAQALAKHSLTKWAQLPMAVRIRIANSKGWDLEDDKTNLSKMWSKFRSNPKMIEDAKKNVAEAEAEEAALGAAAVAGTAPGAPTPQVSNNDDLKEAAMAALTAATSANQAATSSHQGLDKLAGVVEKQGGQISDQGKQISDLKESSNAQSKQIADLADSSRNQFSDIKGHLTHQDGRLNNHDSRLTNVEGRQDGYDARQEKSEGRIGKLEESVRVLSGQCPRDQRSQQQQQNDPNAQLLAVGANAGGYASPPRAASKSSASPFTPPATVPSANVAEKMPPSPPSPSFVSNLGSAGGNGGNTVPPTNPSANVAEKMPPPPPSPSFGSNLGGAGGNDDIPIPSPPSPSSTLDSGFTSSGSSGGNSLGSVGSNGSDDRGSTDVVVSTAPAFGSTFHQYKGFQTDTPGGGGGGGGFVANTGFAGSIGGGGDVDDDDDDDGRGVSKKLFSFDGSTTGGGGFFPTSPPTATATDVDVFGKNNVVDKPSSEVILLSPPLNTLLPTLKAVENVDGEAKWGQRSSMAKYKIVVDPTKSSARLTIHDNGFHLVLNHSITPQIKLEPYNKRDDSWVWTARDYSRNESGTVTTFQLRFADERVAAAFGEKFKEAQEMMTK